MVNPRFSNAISRRIALAALDAPAVSAVAGAAWWILKDSDRSLPDGAAQHWPIVVARKKIQPAAPSRDEVRREAAKRTLQQLDWAEEESRRRIDGCLRPIGAFFAHAKDRLPLFAEDALSWTSERYLVADYVWPWSSGDWQRDFLQERWERHLFAPDDLTKLIQRSAQEYADAMNQTEQEMLIRMRLDVEDLPHEALPEFADEQRLAVEFRGAIDAAVKHAQMDVGRQIELFVVAEVAERVLARVALQLAPRAGLLGAGAVASPYSLGLSMLAALIINYLIELVWDWWADPKGTLVDEIAGQLDGLRRMIVEGDGTAPGLRGEFEEYARQRAGLRANAIASLLTAN